MFHRTHSWIDRALRPFARVEAGEGLVAILMFLAVFTILCAYYVLKTVREGLILTGGMAGLGGDELKVYANGAMALLLVGIVPAYGRLVDRVGRIRLLNISYGVVLACLGAFFLLGQTGAPIGLAFYIWLGIVSVFLVAQFWSYATDIYSEEQGKRLFAVIAIGGSAGAIVGPKLTSVASTYPLLLLAAAMLAGCVALFNVIDRIHARHPGTASAAPSSRDGGFTLVMRDRYLLLIAALSLVGNLVNTTGEFVLSSYVSDHVASAAAKPQEQRELIKAFYGNFFFWVNLIGFLIQTFIVSRAIGRIGVRGALFVLPVVALGAYAAIALVGGIALVRAAKIAENSLDYSLNNTVGHALFLPTDRGVKYKAKAAIDTFFVRFGDTVSAVLVGVGIHQLGLGAAQLSLVNVGLVAIWLAITVSIARHHRALDPALPAARVLAPALRPSTVGASS